MLPLRKNEHGKILPIKNKNARTICTPEELVFFFKHCISPRERKFKNILLSQLGCECRIGEACAINLKDFIDNTSFRELDMLIQKKVKWVTRKNGKKERVGNNVIERKYLPESIAAHLRSWINDNWTWILEYEGYIFPPSKMQKKGLHTKPEIVERWMTNKRKILKEKYPQLSFGEITGKRVYNDISNMKFKKSKIENTYLWRTHLMKKFSVTYGYLLEKDLIFAQQLASHEDPRTTQKHYIDGMTVAPPERRVRVKNKIFDLNFYEQIRGENEKVIAVWEKIPSKKATKRNI